MIGNGHGATEVPLDELGWPGFLVRLVVDIPVLPASIRVEEITARNQVGVSVAVEDIEAFSVAKDLAVFALLG